MEHEEEHKEEKEVEEIPVKEKISGGNFTNKVRENPWILSTLVLGIVTLILLAGNFSGGMTGKVVSSTEVGNNLVEYLNGVADSEITLVSVEDEGYMYLVTIEFKEEEIPVYVTKDGSYYTMNLLPITTESSSNNQEQVQDIPKSDKPVVELFVMTHCPYGTQAEKGFIPAIKALGDTIDANIRFIHYFMHEPEETETPIQVCIREEQPDKYLDYLECFLEDGDSDRCLTEVEINQGELDDCVNKRAEEYYTEDSDLSENYGVKGSPTLVINGKIVSSSRSPSAYLDSICQAFNDAPNECSTELSSATPSPMWGYDEGTETSAQC